MKDKFIKYFLEKLEPNKISAVEIRESFDLQNQECRRLFASVDVIYRLIGDIDRELELQNKRCLPKTKFLFIEDGSVDSEELIRDLDDSNPEIKVVVYRQGSRPPELIDNAGGINGK